MITSWVAAFHFVRGKTRRLNPVWGDECGQHLLQNALGSRKRHNKEKGD
jgi:hypothetical protein